MRLKDLFELQTLGFDKNSVVEIYDMRNLQEDLEKDRFESFYIPKKLDQVTISYGFIIDGTTLVAMPDEMGEGEGSST